MELRLGINKSMVRYFTILLLIFSSIKSSAQSGSLQNIYVGNDAYMAVFGSQSFQPGYITTARTTKQGYLAFMPGATYTGATDAVHVNGYVSKLGNEAFTFPVGDGTQLRTLSISAPTSATTQLGVAWFKGDPGTVQDPTDGAVHATTKFTGNLTVISNLGFWDWVPLSGSVNGLNVTVSIPAVPYPANTLRLVGWDGTNWIDLSNGSSTATGNTAGSTLSGTIPASPTAITAIAIGANYPLTDLAITKNVDNRTPRIGSNVVFTLVASNGGPNDASGVSVKDSLPLGYTYLSSTAPTGTNYDPITGVWTIGNLANGANQTLTITATVTATNNYANTATINGNQADLNLTNNTVTLTPTPSPVTDLSIKKTVDNLNPDVGSNVTFTLTASNLGPSAASGITVNDLLQGGYTFVTSAPLGAYNSSTGVWTVGNLSNGATDTLTITAKVNPSGPYTNAASIQGAQYDPVNTNNNANVNNIIPSPIADLSVTKTASNSSPLVGSNVTFTLLATNTGPSNATGVSVRDTLPSGYTYVSASNGSYSANSGTWTIGNLASGASQTLTITAKVNASGIYANNATISGNQIDRNLTNNTSTSTPVPLPTTDLEIKKSVDVKNPLIGSNVIFTLNATNKGPNNATLVKVNDLLPSGYTYVSASSTDYTPGTGIWDIGNLANGASQTLAITAKVNLTGDYLNKASIAGYEADVVTGNNRDSIATSPLPSTDLSITKTVNNKTPDVGSNVDFTLTASNLGPNAATNVKVADKLPTGYTFVSVSPSGASYNSTTGQWTINDLAVGSTANLTITARVNASGVYNNSATISGTEMDPVAANNTASETTTPTPVANLTLAKSVDKLSPKVGDNVMFTLLAANTGPSNATGVSVKDSLPSGYTYVSHNAPGGTDYNNITGVWSIGNLTNGASRTLTITAKVNASNNVTGEYANTATISGTQKNSNPTNATSTSTPVPLKLVDLGINKTVDIANPYVGNNVVFTLLATNAGPSDATGVSVNDLLPEGYTYVSASSTSYNPGTGVWTIGNLANGASQTLTITATVNSTRIYNNTASISGNEMDSNPANNNSSVNSTPIGLQITKTGFSTISAGQEINYTVVVTNTNRGDAKQQLIVDTVPSSITNVSWTAVAQGDATISSGATGSNNNNVMVIGDIPTGAGNAIRINITGTIPATSKETSISNIAQIVTPGAPLISSAPSTTTVTRNAGIDITKSALNEAVAGYPFTYSLNVVNRGPAAADSVKIVDLIPPGLTGVSWKAIPQNNAVILGAEPDGTLSGTGNVNILAQMPAGPPTSLATVLVTINGKLASNYVGDTIVNTATATPENGITNTRSGTNTVKSAVAKKANVRVTKSGPSDIGAGDAITYGIRIVNEGPSDVENMSIKDSISTDIEAVSWTVKTTGNASTNAPLGGSGDIDILGNIAAGAGNVIEITVKGRVLSTTTDGKQIKNVAVVKLPADVASSNEDGLSSSVNTLVDNTTEVRVSKAGPGKLSINDPIIYTIVVTNAKNSQAEDLIITDTVPSSVRVVDWTITPSGGATINLSEDAITGTGNIINIANGVLPGQAESANAKFTLVINGIVNENAESSFTNKVTVIDGELIPKSSVTTTLNQSTDLYIEKSGPQRAFAGDSIRYSIKVGNNGPLNVNGLTITDLIPSEVENVTWTATKFGQATFTGSGVGITNDIILEGYMPVGPSNYIIIDVKGKIKSSTPRKYVTNNARVTLPSGIIDYNESNNNSQTRTLIEHETDLMIEKTVDKLAPRVADTVVFTLTARNDGPSDANKVVVNDLLPAGYTFISSTYPFGTTGDWEIGTLPVGTTVSNTIKAIVNATGPYPNTASITDSLLAPRRDEMISTVIVSPVPHSNRSVSKTVDNNNPGVGSEVNFTLVASNQGPSVSTGTVVFDKLPAGYTFISATPAAKYNAGSGAWTIVDLAVGVNDTLQIKARVNANGPYKNTATIKGNEENFALVKDTTSSVTPNPSPRAHLNTVKTLKNANQSNFAPGDTVMYIIKVTNEGPSTADSVNIVDIAPAGTTITAWKAIPSNGVNYPNLIGSGDLNETIAELPNGSIAIYEITVQTPTTHTDSLVNSVVAKSTTIDPNPVTCTTCSTTPIPAVPKVHLNTIKTLKYPAQSTFAPGDTVVYRISVTNEGPSDAESVKIVDTAPVGTTITAWKAITSNGVNYPNELGTGDLDETISKLPNGATAIYEVTVKTPSNYKGNLVNTVDVKSTTLDTNPGCDSCSTTPSTPEPKANLYTEKTLKDPAQADFAPGEAVVYSIKVTNQGPSDAASVKIVDTAPTGTTITAWKAIPSTGVTYPSTSGSGNLNQTIVNLPNGAIASYEVTVKTPSNFSGPLVNKAGVTSTTPNPDPNYDPELCSTCITPPSTSTPKAHLNTVKTLSDTSQKTFAPGDTILYVVKVTNQGPSDAATVNIVDNAPMGTTISSWKAIPSTGVAYPSTSGTGDLNQTIVSLPNGATAIYEVAVKTPSNFSGTLVNTVTASSSTIDPNPVPCDSCSTTPSTPEPMAHLNTIKTLKYTNQNTFVPGDTVVYSIKVTNEGPSDATAVNIVDNAPAGTTITAWKAIPSTGVTYPNDLGSGSLNETIAKLPNGATAMYEVTVKTPSSYTGSLVNKVTASSNTPDPDPEPCTTCSSSPISATPQAHLNTVKTLIDNVKGNFAPGDTLVYRISVTNEGPSDAESVTIVDTAPVGTTIKAWKAVPSTGVTYPNDFGAGDLNETIAKLPNGTTAIYEIVVKTPSNYTGKTIVNSVDANSLTTDPNPGTCTTCSTTPTPSEPKAHLNTVKTLKDPSQTTFAPGDVVVYVIKVTNEGPSDAKSVNIVDTAPAETTISGWNAIPSTGVTYPNNSGTGTLNETIASLPNGAIAIYEVMVKTASNYSTSTLVNKVSAISNTPDPDPNYDPDACTTCSTTPTTAEPKAHLNTVKTLKDLSQTTFAPGDTVVYVIKVTNEGPSDAKSVNIVDNAPAGTSISKWKAIPSTGVTYPNVLGTGDLNETIADLPNGAIATYEVTVKTPVTYTNNLVNKVTASSTTPDPDPNYDPGDCTTCSTTPTPAAPKAHLNTVKTLKDPDQSTFAPGDAVVYVIKVTNEGPSNAESVKIVDTAPVGTTISNWIAVPSTGVNYPNVLGTGNLDETIATLPNGATATYEVTVQTLATYTDNLINKFTASSTTPDPDPNYDRDACTTCSTTPLPPQLKAHLNIVKTLKDPNQSTFAPGDAVVYVIKVTNEGPSNAESVNIVDTAPVGTTISNWIAIPSTGVNYPSDLGTGDLDETIAILPNGATAIYEVTVQTPSNYSSSTLVNKVSAISSTPDPDPNYDPEACTTCSTPPTTAEPKAHLNTVKTLKDPNQSTFAPGDEVVYVIKVTNEGPSDATAVNIVDTAPTGTTISSWKAITSAGVTYPSIAGTGNLNQTIISLPNGATAIYEVTVQTPSNYSSSTLVNKVTASSTTPDPDPNYDPGACTTCSTTPTPAAPKAHLYTVKTLKDPNQSTFAPGDKVVYVISVNNQGPSNAESVKIVDTAPVGTTISSWKAVPSTGVTYPNDLGTGNLNETIATLLNGTTAIYEVTVQTPATYTDNLINKVTVSSTTPDPDPNYDPGDCTSCSTTPTPAAPKAHLNTVKTLKDPNQSKFTPGDAVVYVIRVTNEGPSNAAAVNIVDNAPAGTTISGWKAIPSTGVTYPSNSGAGNLNQTIVSLPNGATAIYEVTVQTARNFTGTLVNKVTASSTTPDPDPNYDSGACTTCSTTPISTTPKAHLNTVKTLKDPNQSTFAPGDAVVYVIKVTNEGPSDATAVNIVDTAPAGTTISNWKAITSAGVTYPSIAGTGNLNQTIISLPNGATAIYEVTVQTPSNFTGTLVNKVTASSTTPDPDPNYDPGACTTCSTTPTPAAPKAHLNTVKTLKNPSQASFIPGDAVVYVIKVTNQGPSDAKTVNIQDMAPTGTTISNWTAISSLGVSYPNLNGTGNLNETLATLPNGAVAIYEVTVSTTSSFTGALVNVATATSTTPDPNPSACTTCSTSPLPIGNVSLVVPNAITPNGDGKNDRLVIDGLDRYQGADLIIYNRWGNQVYHNKNYDNSWTGEGLSGGTYYYLLTVKAPQETKVYKGWITLMK